ncbi:hypothetical protein ACSAZK_14405 [Methanosarcina sp. Mfa9]|uniref:hypothetical protein n=1 Tax=Methanosarcina sp. Mfa9 TaxID=3439063 RepID=UPI003F82E194
MQFENGSILHISFLFHFGEAPPGKLAGIPTYPGHKNGLQDQWKCFSSRLAGNFYIIRTEKRFEGPTEVLLEQAGGKLLYCLE